MSTGNVTISKRPGGQIPVLTNTTCTIGAIKEAGTSPLRTSPTVALNAAWARSSSVQSHSPTSPTLLGPPIHEGLGNFDRCDDQASAPASDAAKKSMPPSRELIRAVQALPHLEGPTVDRLSRAPQMGGLPAVPTQIAELLSRLGPGDYIGRRGSPAPGAGIS